MYERMSWQSHKLPQNASPMCSIQAIIPSDLVLLLQLYIMPPSETVPLLSSNGDDRRAARQIHFFASSKHLIFGSWLNALIVAVPICIAAELLHWPAAARFSTSFLAIVPLAKVCTCIYCANYAAPRRCD